ncbi:MAG: sigma-70 family RNA polymerase sigma factor [Bacteroides sp.]|nr:sigma-70 family RNA polymerase sigma factor [Bacteroides sp.]
MSEETLISTFTRLRKRLLHMATSYLHSSYDADDVLQDAFCRLWPRADSLDTPQVAEAMAVTTVRNLSIDKWRRRTTREEAEFDAERDTRLSESPVEEMERQERYEQLKLLIEKELSPVQQQILHLREYEELEMAEIAERVGMTQENVRVNLSRARKRIREAYQERRNIYEG